MSGKSKSGQNCAFVEYEKPDQAGTGTPERWKWTPAWQAMGTGSKIGQEGDSPKWMDRFIFLRPNLAPRTQKLIKIGFTWCIGVAAMGACPKLSDPLCKNSTADTLWKINIDPENDQFIVETSLPTPISARVYCMLIYQRVQPVILIWRLIVLEWWCATGSQCSTVKAHWILQRCLFFSNMKFQRYFL